MAWLRLVDVDAKLMFNPRVTPDPADAKRLEEKLQDVMQLRKPDVSSRRKFSLLSMPVATQKAEQRMQHPQGVATHGLTEASTR